MTDPLHTHQIGRSTIQGPEADRATAFAQHLPFAQTRTVMTDTVKSADVWTETARNMLATWDGYLGGHAQDQRENAHRLLLAASFARAQFEDLAALDPDAATGGMLRAFLLALIDPAIPDLDHLRACNRPTPAPQGEAAPIQARGYDIDAMIANLKADPQGAELLRAGVTKLYWGLEGGALPTTQALGRIAALEADIAASRRATADNFAAATKAEAALAAIWNEADNTGDLDAIKDIARLTHPPAAQADTGALKAEGEIARAESDGALMILAQTIAERDAALARVTELETALAARGEELTSAWQRVEALTPQPDADLISRAKSAITGWLNEPEAYGLRVERLHHDATHGNDLTPWLIEAFKLGSALAQAQARGGMTKAAQDVLAERQRQISAEGWTPEHDDEHRQGELAAAAATYALSAQEAVDEPTWRTWPFQAQWLKLSSPRRDLVKSGALIIAEIERLDRAALIPTPAKGEV